VSTACQLCGSRCQGADLAPLLSPSLTWLWEQLAAAADRRGDTDLTTGTLTLKAPKPAEQRAAVVGLLGGRVLAPGQSRRIDLADLTTKLRVRGAHLTPGAVTAHAVRRRLAVRSRAKAQRAGREQDLQTLFNHLMHELPKQTSIRPDPSEVWPILRRAGWVARLHAAEDPARLLRTAITIVAALPRDGKRSDRRQLAFDSTGNPHALDDGTRLAGFVLAVLVAAGAVHPRQRQRPRQAWDQIGVDCDDLTGGLIAVGIVPDGWRLPPGTPVTLPPRVLATCPWPAPNEPGRWVFDTENPSVASAAADLSADGADVRLLCTSGTPSTLEIGAIARLASAGWRVAVRADFDEAGLASVAAMLDGVPSAVPWRMSLDDYKTSLASTPDDAEQLSMARLPSAPWASQLSQAMQRRRLPGFEEALMPQLLDDICRGAP